jgi:hypothetical protein
MAQKKPIWTSTEAHARLKAYCAAASRTQLEVVSELILTNLDPDNVSKDDEEDSKKSDNNQHFGGVWVV